MLAKRVGELPAEGDWIFEPKWDGFRALVFREGDEILIQSRDEKPLDRYFPELHEPLRSSLPARCVLDGEIVIVRNDGLDFDSLQLRLHPAAKRVNLLSQQTPSSFVFFDLLCLGDRDLRGEPFQIRRRELESLIATAPPPIHLTPATTDRNIASDWFRRFEGAGLDGVMAKSASGTYVPNKRVMLKVKHERDCDCVVAGFRWYKKGDRTLVGSLLLGLFDDAGALQHVGVCASFSTEKRRELAEFLEPYRKDALVSHPWRAWAEHGAEPGESEADAEQEPSDTEAEESADENDPSNMRYRLQRRGGKGVKDVRVTDKNGPVIGIAAVRDGDEIMLITRQGMVVRTSVDAIRVTGRNAQGVRVMNANEGDKLATLAKVASEVVEK